MTFQAENREAHAAQQIPLNKEEIHNQTVSDKLNPGDKVFLRIPASEGNGGMNYFTLDIKRNEGSFSFLDGSRTVKEVTFSAIHGKQEIKIGRAVKGNNSIQMGYTPEEAVRTSGSHCTVTVYKDGRIAVADHSTNGTFIRKEIHDHGQEVPKVASQTEKQPKKSRNEFAPLAKIREAFRALRNRNSGVNLTKLYVGNTGEKQDTGGRREQYRRDPRYLDALPRYEKAYVRKSREQPGMIDKRLRITPEGVIDTPVIRGPNDWERLANSLAEIRMQRGTKVDLDVIYVFEHDEGRPNKLGDLRASIDVPQIGEFTDLETGMKYSETRQTRDRSSTELDYAVMKHAMLLTKKGGYKEAAFGGEMVLDVVCDKQGKYSFNVQRINGDSGGLKPEVYQAKVKIVTDALRKTGLNVPTSAWQVRQ
jgi:hypothetical protein